MNEDINEIKEALLEKDFYKRILLVLSGTFILAINYNLFLLPNHFVIGGLSGIAIIVQTALGWDPTMFLYIATIILTFISLAFFGLKNTSASIIGSILYPVFITATVPLTTYLKQYVIFDNIVLTLLFAGILFGFATGIIYKAGFDTGGSDIIIHMIQKFFHFSEGNSSRIVQGMIILSGGFVFGLNQMIYALLILAIYTAVIDKITIGISDSKQFLIHTDESKKVEEFIMHELHTGVTILESEGGFSKEKGTILMCVVPNKDYFLFKEKILTIDPGAFIIINDCYEVRGGKKDRNIPFM